MPLYEYQCDACSQRFEVIQKFSDPAPETCRKCGKGPVHRLASSPAIQFKGTGWYITDYAKGNSAGAAAGSSRDEGEKKESAADGKTSGDSKSDAKTESGSKTESKSDSSASPSPAPASSGSTTPAKSS